MADVNLDNYTALLGAGGAAYPSADGDTMNRAKHIAGVAQVLNDHDHTTGRGKQIPTGGIADEAVTGAKIAAAIKDAAAATPSLRTLGTGATQAAAGNHTHATTGSSVLDRDQTATTVSNTTTETSVYSYSVPGGTLSTNRKLRLTILGRFLNNTGAGANVDWRAKAGGATLCTIDPASPGASASQKAVKLVFEIENVAATNVQRATLHGVIGTAGPTDTSGGPGGGGSMIATNTGAVDTTAAWTLEVTAQMSAASANLQFIADTAVLEAL